MIDIKYHPEAGLLNQGLLVFHRGVQTWAPGPQVSRLLTNTTGETGQGIFSQGLVRFRRGPHQWVELECHWHSVDQQNLEQVRAYIKMAQKELDHSFGLKYGLLTS